MSYISSNIISLDLADAKAAIDRDGQAIQLLLTEQAQ
jgi:hypothetical protein